MATETTKEKAPQASGSYSPHFIFAYSTVHLSGTGKVRFHYALKGRDGKSGVLQKTKAEPLGKAVLLVKQENADTIELFLKEWKCVFHRKEVFMNK